MWAPTSWPASWVSGWPPSTCPPGSGSGPSHCPAIQPERSSNASCAPSCWGTSGRSEPTGPASGHRVVRSPPPALALAERGQRGPGHLHVATHLLDEGLYAVEGHLVAEAGHEGDPALL